MKLTSELRFFFIWRLALIGRLVFSAFFGVILIMLSSCFYGDEDPFLNDLFVAYEGDAKSRSDISSLITKYIRAGDSTAETIVFLERRGFVVHKTDSASWALDLNGAARYVAEREDIRNILVRVKAVVIFDDRNGAVSNISGKIHLTGL